MIRCCECEFARWYPCEECGACPNDEDFEDKYIAFITQSS